MAMTKAEKARMEELETALALCWPAYAEPQVMTAEEVRASTVVLPSRSESSMRTRTGAIGWFFNAHTGEVTKGWSNGVSHCREGEYGDSSASQQHGRIYRTREQAAMAMRIEMSREFARKLAAVDRIIRGEP